MKKIWLSSCFLLATVGCSGSGTTTQTGPAATAVDQHDHSSEGPHHGTLVELGNEEYHAEVLHSGDTVTIYILDAAAKNAVPIEAAEVTINVMHDGKPEQFRLAASSEGKDETGKSSRFAITDADLASHMDDHVAAPKLNVIIAGKAYRGEVHHDHDLDHAGHDHK